MTVFNDLRFLDEAVESVLGQEFGDLELIIVNDGAGAHPIFDDLVQRDSRLRLIVNPTNLGTAAAANRGIDAAQADLIVRLDADDVSEPSRIGRLVEALDSEPALGLVGSSATLIDEAGLTQGVARMPQTDLEIRWTILFHNPFYHSAVAFRRACFEKAGRYRENELVSQDHYLWFDMLPHCRMRNLAEPLVRYRMNSRGLTTVYATNPRNRTHAIREALWKSIGLRYDLYDDALAGDVSAFLRGNEIAEDRRAAAYRVILAMLARFLAASTRQAAFDDVAAAGELRRKLVERILAAPPPERAEAIEIDRLCSVADPQPARTHP
jgi:glycosyltransferase involved in cell wall biosynthesis